MKKQAGRASAIAEALQNMLQRGAEGGRGLLARGSEGLTGSVDFLTDTLQDPEALKRLGLLGLGGAGGVAGGKVLTDLLTRNRLQNTSLVDLLKEKYGETYTEGFITKCAESGVDPEKVLELFAE